MNLPRTSVAQDSRTSGADVKQIAGRPRRKRICIVTNAPISQNRPSRQGGRCAQRGRLRGRSPVCSTCRMDASHGPAHPGSCNLARVRRRGMVGGGGAQHFKRGGRCSDEAIPAIVSVFNVYSARGACLLPLPPQLFLAVRIRADLYIGHNPQSLPIVAWGCSAYGREIRLRL